MPDDTSPMMHRPIFGEDETRVAFCVVRRASTDRDPEPRLTKRVERVGDGLRKEAAASMWQGYLREVEAPSGRAAGALAETIAKLGVDEALILGVPVAPWARSAARARAGLPVVLAGQAKEGVSISRTKESIAYQSGAAAWVVIDFDMKWLRDTAVVERVRLEFGGDWTAALASVLPAGALDGIARLRRPSLSGRIRDAETGERMADEAGEHLFILLADGADAERTLRVWHQRLCLAGLGLGAVSKAGTLLMRSLVDTATSDGGRLVFEAPPILGDGLALHTDDAALVVHEGEVFDSRVDLPDLTDDERGAWERLHGAERRRLADRLRGARARWEETYAEQLVARGVDEATAKRTARQAADGVLTTDAVLMFDRLGPASVGEVLADLDRYDRQTLADPHEPEEGRNRAVFYRTGKSGSGPPRVVSLLHGGVIYKIAGKPRAEPPPPAVPVGADGVDEHAAAQDGPPDRPAGAEDGVVTEDSVALEFEWAHAGELRFCHTQGAWFRWTGSIWQQEQTGLAFDWCRRRARTAASGGAAGAQRVAGRANFAGGVEKFARAARAFAITADQWDTHCWLLATPGGTVDLRTGLVLPARREDLITRATAVAPTDRAECPTWLTFMDQACGGDGDLVAFMQRWSGYCLTGDISEHSLVFLWGPGGNGKGVFLNTLASLIGDYAVNAPMDTFVASKGDRHPADLAMLRGSRLVMSTETEDGRTWAEQRIKALTGGDPITARFMRQDFFTYLPTFKITISGNAKPRLQKVGDAMRRRFKLINFTYTPPKPDPLLADKLRAEWGGILRWMIDGSLEWQRGGLNPPAVVKEATDEYFAAEDFFARWLDERCILDPLLATKPSVLFKDFQEWSRANGEAATDNRIMKERLEGTPGLRYAQSQGKQIVRGIGLRPREGEDWRDA